MTSRRTEKVHQELIEKILQDTGLECTRSSYQSPESSISSQLSEEMQSPEETTIASPEPELEEEIDQGPLSPEHEADLSPEVFPTPSLRFPLSERAREIEKQNRIHVLPETFNKSVDPLAIPKIAVTPPQRYIDELAEITGCKRYRSCLAEYWFLDTLANLLRRAQEDEMDRPTQAVLILWFCEWMKEMQHFDAADRQRMMRRFEENMMAAGKILSVVDYIPTPADAGVHYEAIEEPELGDTAQSVSHSSKNLTINLGATSYECALRDLANIIHYIFDLFSTDYQYNLVRSVFTHTPDYHLIDAPYQIQYPKRLFTVPKVKPKPLKHTKSAMDKLDKVKKKKDDNIIQTAEFLKLMEQKAREDRMLEEQAELDRERWYRKSHILPLGNAVDDEFFNKYWPQPVPEPPAPLAAESSKPILKGKK